MGKLYYNKYFETANHMHGISIMDKLGLCLKTMNNSTGFKEDNRLLRDPVTFSLPKKS
jgi:hypothetical protein